uniref:MAGUK p55 subfamily member 2-like n=1 Tax=Myxine glutinosa TaxID=7769 RepID=UPI00358FF95B
MSLQSLLEVHDSVASRSYEQLPCGSEGFGPPGSGGTQDIMLGEAVRVVGIRKMDGEPLGVTFRVDGGELVIARILRGGAIDRQGLLHVGDVIREVNGHEVAGDPSGLQNSLRDASGSVVLKVLPSYTKPPFSSQIFVKCHFDYDPTTDHLIPCREAGLAFSQGEVLQIVSLDDPSWWQSRNLEFSQVAMIALLLLVIDTTESLTYTN